jgi:hypothetical protein
MALKISIFIYFLLITFEGIRPLGGSVYWDKYGLLGTIFFLNFLTFMQKNFKIDF